MGSAPALEASRQRTRPPAGWRCDGQTFVEIYERHSAAVFAVAARVGLPHLAADVTQETFLRLWRDPMRFDPSRGSLRGFLVVVARGLAIDQARAETARSARERRSGHGPSSCNDAAERLLAAATLDEVTAALRRLDTDSREAIVAAFFGGLTYADAARVLGAPEGTVKSRIRRGLLQLRDDLASQAVLST